jgi:DHA1 family multidrug resistance protein-like MFS transporter
MAARVALALWMASTSSATNTSRADFRAYAIFSAPYSFVVFLLPFYVFELGGGRGEVGVAYALYALAIVLTRPASGGLVDSVGRRRVLAVGGVALAAAMALLGFSTAVLHVYAALFLAGVASSLVNVAVVAYVSDVGGLEELYSKMRVAAARGAVAGGVSIPAAYVLSGVAGYAVAFRALALAFAAASLIALAFLPGETRHLSSRHKWTDMAAAACVIWLPFLLGLALGLYGPQILPHLHLKFSLSPFTAILVYLPAVVAWLYGPRPARPSRRVVAAGTAVMSIALLGMSLSPSPVLFSVFWLLESFGVAAVSTALDQSLARHVAGAYWGRGYGVYQAVNNLGYSLGAAASGYLPDPFINAVVPLVALLASLSICKAR